MHAMNLTGLAVRRFDVEWARPTTLRILPPPAPPIGAPSTEPAALGLAELWARLLAGHCYVRECRFSDDRCHFRLTFGSRRPPNPESRELVERVLLGESQKAVAIDLGISPSAASLSCSIGMSAISFERRALCGPVALVMGVHAAHGYALPHARVHAVEGRHWDLSVERPDRRLPECLSPAEQAIVRQLVEGRTCDTIAALRKSSLRTVANQLASIFRKLRVSGRGQLRAELVKRQAASFGP
jgi:DNA-binding CsgD family transcriptional regulator